MRIKLSNPQTFFDEILKISNQNIKQLSKDLNLNYSNIKQYRRGVKLFPEEIFNNLIEKSPNKEFWLKDTQRFEDNWGSIKGGKIISKKSNNAKRTEYARKFRKITKVNIKLNEFFCEFYGALLGDGCISKFRDSKNNERYVILFSGNKRLDSDYFKYLKNKLLEEYNLSTYYYESKKQNVCIISIKNKRLCLELNKSFDVPIGIKYEKLKLSKKVLDLQWNFKKYLLRGLFDTDGCILANKREKYRYPWISISSKSESFRNELIKLLREQDYPAYITGNKDVCVRGIANVKRWFSDIGSSNNRNKYKYEYFLKHGYLPARLLS